MILQAQVVQATLLAQMKKGKRKKIKKRIKNIKKEKKLLKNYSLNYHNIIYQKEKIQPN